MTEESELALDRTVSRAASNGPRIPRATSELSASDNRKIVAPVANRTDRLAADLRESSDLAVGTLAIRSDCIASC